MPLIHIRDTLQGVFDEFAALFSRYDPRGDISRRARTEINLARKTVRLFGGVRAAVPLDPSQLIQETGSLETLGPLLPKGREVVISIDKENCFCRTLTLPARAGRSIDEILNLEIGRVTPFSRADVFSAWYMVEAPRHDGFMTIEHVIIRKAIAGKVIDYVRKAGAKVHAIVVRNGGAAALPVAFAEDGRGFGSDRLARWSKLAAAGIVLLAVGGSAVAFAHLHRQSLIVADLDARIAVLQEKAAAVRQRLAMMEAKSHEISALRARKESSPSVLDAWEELTRILPDSAWLISLNMQGQAVTVEGMAESAETLIAQLEASPIIEHVKFTAPIYKNPAEAKSRFSLTFEIPSKDTGAGQ